VTNVTYVNQRVTGAVSVTTPQAFTSAQSVSKNSVRFDAREVSSAPVVATTPAVAPSRQAVLGSGATAMVHPPAALQTRAVVAKTAPPPPPPSFAKQQQAIQANGGRPLAMSEARQLQPATAQVHANIKIAPPAKPQTIQARGVQPNASKPATPVNAASRTVTPPANNPNRPPSARPNAPATTTNANPQLDQKHQLQVQDLRSQQDLERQKVEQQQQQERADLAKKAADDQTQQKLNQQHQQQLEDLEKKHDAEEAKLKQQQQAEKKNPPKPAKPAKEDKPPKKDK